MNNTSKSVKTMVSAILWGVLELGYMHMADPNTPPLMIAGIKETAWVWLIIAAYGLYGYCRKD